MRLHAADDCPVDASREQDGGIESGEVPYKVTIDGQSRPIRETEGGWTRILVAPSDPHQEVTVEWGTPDSNGKYPYQRKVIVASELATERERTHAHLFNLGYRFELTSDEEYEAAARSFQEDYGIEPVKGLVGKRLPAKARSRLAEIYANGDASPEHRQGNEVQIDEIYNPELGYAPVTPVDDSGLTA
jgi:hypothetical protein